MHLFEEMISSQSVYKGRIFDVNKDTVKLEDNTIAEREYLIHSGGVCVVPITENNEIILVKQFRYPTQEVLIEVPAGKLNIGEDHFECGKRELLEETGATANKLSYLGYIFPTPAYLTEKIHVYLATELTFSQQNLDKDEFLDVIKIPFDKAIEMIMSNEIKDAKTQVAIMKAYFYLKGGI